MERIRLPAAAALLAPIALLLAAGLAVYSLDHTAPDFSQPALVLKDQRLSHPGDIVRFKGRYVATLLYDDRLAVFDNTDLDGIEYFDPADIGEQFKSPHFLAVSPEDTLLISNGWGDSIVEIANLEGGQWKELSGGNGGFRAPHGLCVDNDGWIYVGDSLNSRLVRFKNMDGDGWQLFADKDSRVSYIRELVCRDGVVWASNSYEKRPGMNPGRGSNILKITDFESGNAEIVHAFPDTNMTGILPIGRDDILVGLWGPYRRLARIGLTDAVFEKLPRTALGVPYGTFLETGNRRVWVAHTGDVSNNNRKNPGGIVIYD